MSAPSGHAIAQQHEHASLAEPSCRISSSARLCWELEEPKGPKGWQSSDGGPAARVGVTLYTHCADDARLLCGHAPRGAMLGAPLVATTSEGRTMLVGVLSSDAPRDETAGGVSDTPGGGSATALALRFADVGSARAWILAASGLIRANRFLHFLAMKTSTRMCLTGSSQPFV